MSGSSHEDGMAKLLSQLQKVDVSPGTGQPKTLEEMDMTPAEIERLGNCMKDPKFMELFQEYADAPFPQCKNVTLCTGTRTRYQTPATARSTTIT
jgi:hypothetical protein